MGISSDKSGRGNEQQEKEYENEDRYHLATLAMPTG